MNDQKPIRTIGVMTSGGDAPGMNPCLRAVVRTGVARGLRVIGIEGGYEGLIHGAFRDLGPRDVGSILQRGGTILKTARSTEFRTPRGQREAIRQMNGVGMDALVVIGGDGSLSGAQALSDQGIPVAGIPASIDNDIYGTDMCIGVDTAMNTIVDAIDKLRDTASSHNRAFLIETMGRACGYLALTAGIVCGAEITLIPEVKTSPEDIAAAVEAAYTRGKTHCIIVIAEGFRPRTTDIAQMLTENDLGFDVRVTILGHVQRGGNPTASDRLLATRFGAKAVDLLMEGKTAFMTGLHGNVIEAVPIMDVVTSQRQVTDDYIKMAGMLAR